MTEPEESPAPRWRWLDRWFEPRWRALLTWVVLAVLTGLAFDLGTGNAINSLVESSFGQLDRVLPTPLLGGPMQLVALVSNTSVLLFWMEPLALRLNLVRGLAWLGLRIVPYVAMSVFDQDENDLVWALGAIASSALAALALLGWRSRPWMSIIGGTLIAGVSYSVDQWDAPVHIYNWTVQLVTSLPYAAVLLYGTRRLPR